VRHDVVHLAEVHRLDARPLAREREPVLDVVHADHASCAHEPRRLRGEQADRAAAVHDYRVAAADVAHFRAHVACREDVGQEEHVLVRHVVRDLHRADVAERHAHVLRLSSLVPARRVRVAIHAARELAVRVRVLAQCVQLLLAVVARAARDVERHRHPVARANAAALRPHLLDDARELVAERRAHTRVRHQPAVQVQV
jgi:hypothetical protein